MAEREEHGAEDDNDADLDQRGPVLQVGAFAGAPDVDGGDDRDHCHGYAGGFERRERDDFGEITGKGAGQGRHGAAGDYQEQAPAVEEGGHAAEAIANEDVEAASFGIRSG